MRFICLLPIAISLSLLLQPTHAQETSTTDHRPQDSRLQPLKDLNGFFPLHVPDTKESWDANLFPPVDVDPIIERVSKTPAKTIVVTGGEPSRYPLDYFTGCLKKEGVTTMIETAGVMPLTGNWDWICLSPKKYSPPHESVYQIANELKVVIEDQLPYGSAGFKSRGKKILAKLEN